MKGKEFSVALGKVSDGYVAEAAAYRKRIFGANWIKTGIAAACLCLAAGGAGAYCYKLEHPYPVKNMVSDILVSKEFLEEFCLVLKDGQVEGFKEIDRIPRWEEMKIYEQYNEIDTRERHYTVRRGEVPKEQIGAKMGSVTAKGQDNYAQAAGKDGNRYQDAVLYEIAGILPECAVAVQYEGTDVYYCAVNSSYRPETIGEFVNALDLQNTLVFHRAYYDYTKPISGEHVTICFENLDGAKIWEMLLANAAAGNEYDERAFRNEREILGFSVNVPVLGYQNVSIAVLENGYIETNVLDTGKLFCIGEENTQALVDYVLNECEGYEMVWPAAENGSGDPE